MRIPRLHLDQPCATGARLTVSGSPARHIIQVLRLRNGAVVRVFDGSGSEFEASLVETTRSNVRIEIGAAVATIPEPSMHISLVQGIARNDRMDLILQKSVELGVSTLQPVWMQRSQSHLSGERLARRRQHWHGIITSACEQCGRATLPRVHEPLPVAEWFDTQPETGLGLLLQPDSGQSFADLGPAPERVTLLVGPEGGMTPEEQGLALAAGFTGIRLGQRILRTETAGLAALAGIQTLWGDFRL